ncbi:MAG: DNA repair protein RecO [Planctomycetes bacterium]|nr:DNA repair protein RecO [Planctomycetota bacterium]
MLTKDHAICIRATDYSETSQIVVLFTRENGKISAIAKGSKRPKSSFDGPIELFSCGQIIFAASHDSKLATLTEFEQKSHCSGLANNLFSLNCASFATELVNSLTTEYDPHPELFDQFLQFLQNTENSSSNRDCLALLILFQFSLLKEVGVQPILNICVNCKTRHQTFHRMPNGEDARCEIYFSSSANGLICRDCEPAFTDKLKLSAASANCLTDFKKIADANDKTLKEIEKVLIYHFTETLGRPPKMAKHILGRDDVG